MQLRVELVLQGGKIRKSESYSFHIWISRSHAYCTPSGTNLVTGMSRLAVGDEGWRVFVKVLITGATGFVGTELVKACLFRGDEVRALVPPTENTIGKLPLQVEIVRGDVVDARTLSAAVHDIDLVFHLAEITAGRRALADYYLVNVTGAENMYRAALAAHVQRFVFGSSCIVYGAHARGPLTENAALRTLPHAYSLSKVDGDRLMRRFLLTSAMDTVIVRSGLPFGSGDMGYVRRFVGLLRAGKTSVIGSGENLLPFCHVSDVVQGFLLAGFHPRAAGNVYTIAHDRQLTQWQMWKTLADAVGDAVHGRPGYSLPHAHARHALLERMITCVAPLGTSQEQLDRLLLGTDMPLSITKARRELGYEPGVDPCEGMTLAAAALQEGALRPQRTSDHPVLV